MITTWLPPTSATFGYWTAGVKPGLGAGPYPAWAFNASDTAYLAAATVTSPSSSVVPSWADQDQGRVAYTGNCFNGQGCTIAIIPGTTPTMQYSDAGFVRGVMCKGYRPSVPPLPTSNSIPAGLHNLPMTMCPPKMPAIVLNSKIDFNVPSKAFEFGIRTIHTA